MKKTYEAIVVGGGHAGIEAAFALAHKGHQVGLISLDINKLAMMPCNPSIGGPAKGILTREIDALGGMQGFLADQSMIQIKMLNEGKGPAVRALRAQIDKDEYAKVVKKMVEKEANITFISALATKIIVKDNKAIGVALANKIVVEAKQIILTTGTYMRALVLRGQDKTSSGPDGQQTTNELSKSLMALGFELQRLKTGTPPRVYANSIDFSEVEKEVLPPHTWNFSQRSKRVLKTQVSCYLTYTNAKTHEIIQNNLHLGAMYSGQIAGIGPRYCPSIEDKIVRFPDKKRHQIFYEPETIKGDIIYVQGFSTSMPQDVQAKMLKTLPGMAKAKVQKWGYAIEYDAINPLKLKNTLAAKNIDNLYFAGQINGTSGYEEAAAQGLMAGINAALALEKKEPLILTRNLAYIGVLIDDLVTKGTREPYRMLTSRAEYRLLLRNDNVDERLNPLGYQIGLISSKLYQATQQKYSQIANEKIRLANTYVSPKSDLAKKYQLLNGPSYLDVLKRPEVAIQDVSNFPYIAELAIQVRLAGYICKQEVEAKKMLRLEKLVIPVQIDYDKVPNLATEARQKLKIVRPKTIGQATRISGINPADIQMLMFYLEYAKRYQ